jgi:hypothetical protein
MKLPQLYHSSLSRQVFVAESSLSRNRKLIGKYLRRIKDGLSLDSHGFCYCPFKKFIIVVEVPEDERDLCYISTMVYEFHSTEALIPEKMRRLRNTEFLKGATLSVEEKELNLCLSIPIAGLKFQHLEQHLEDFLRAAIRVNSVIVW